MSETVKIKHLDSPNITTFVNGKQIVIKDFQAEVSIEDAKAMMAGPFGYELIGVYDDFIEYVNGLSVNIKVVKSAPGSCILLSTPLTLHKLYSWDKYTESILNLEGKEKLHLCFVLDELSGPIVDKIVQWCEANKNNFYGITLLSWDAESSKAWNRIFKITVSRQLIFNYARSLPDVTHVWFVDSDNMLPIFAMKRLSDVNSEVSAGVYNFKSVISGGPVVFNVLGDRTWPPTCLGQQAKILSEGDEGYPFMESDWVGAGCLLISRRIFEKYNFDWSKWIQRNGEDAWICMCAQHETGQRVKIDLLVKCDHLDERGEIW